MSILKKYLFPRVEQAIMEIFEQDGRIFLYRKRFQRNWIGTRGKGRIQSVPEGIGVSGLTSPLSDFGSLRYRGTRSRNAKTGGFVAKARRIDWIIIEHCDRSIQEIKFINATIIEHLFCFWKM
jgi:hypothetical protein